MARKKKIGFFRAFRMAVRQSRDLTAGEKFKLRMAIALSPGAREAIQDQVIAVVQNAEPAVKFHNYEPENEYDDDVSVLINLDNLERFLEIVMKYLPQILELIFKFI